jgi:probable HAF family extracellular repeat protein
MIMFTRHFAGSLKQTALLCATLGVFTTSTAEAGPAVAAWTITDIGSLGGSLSLVSAINNAGQITGASSLPNNVVQHAFVYDSGRMIDLGTLGGSYSYGNAISDSVQVVGYSYTANNTTARAFSYKQGVMSDLGTLGGTSSFAWAVNNGGQVAGYSYTPDNTAVHAFLYGNGSMRDLGTLGGTYSYAIAINNSGQVAGYSDIGNGNAWHAFVSGYSGLYDIGTLGGTNSFAYGINSSGLVTGSSRIKGDGAEHAFLYSYGAPVDLGTLGGTNSYGLAINDKGQIAGNSQTHWDGATHAFLYSNGTMRDLNGFAGVLGSGWTLNTAGALNNAVQLAGFGEIGNQTKGYLLSLDTVVWESGSSGNWDSIYGWSFALAPTASAGRPLNVMIDPTRSLTVTGPNADTSVKTLTVGGDPTGNNGIATLYLDGGSISVLGSGNVFTTVNAKGVLTGDGRLSGLVVNLGTVTAQNLTLTGGLSNQGLVNGGGKLNANLSNTVTGLVQVAAGQTLTLAGTAHTNAGQIEVGGGGSLVVNGSFANNSGGQINSMAATTRFNGQATNDASAAINLNNAITYFNAGLVNSGQLNVTFGGAQIFGNVANMAGGKVILSGNSNTTFYNDVSNNGELRVSAGSTAVYFGLVKGAGQFTGSGSSFYEGGFHVGNSPAIVTMSGAATFDSLSILDMDIGGTVPGACASCYAQLVFTGDVTFNGNLLKVNSYGGFVPEAGNSFRLFQFAHSPSGTFGAIELPSLPAGEYWDTSALYTAGNLSVAAVPEAASSAYLLSGLVLMGIVAARRRQFHRPGFFNPRPLA